jgi:hypothetical protein
MAVRSFVGPWRLFSFLILHRGGSVRRKTSTYTKATETENKCTQISIPRVGFEPTIPAFERANTVHASDRAATVIG